MLLKEYKICKSIRMQRNLKIRSEIESLRVIEKELDIISSELGIAQDNYGKIMVCAMEAVNNAILHGNKSDPGKFVKVVIEGLNDKLSVSVEDEGPGFNPEEIPDPTKPENIEEISGRGIFLMSKLADSISFSEKGNKVTMEFKNIRT
jgi:serine/threonine-protein kinase RsbW